VSATDAEAQRSTTEAVPSLARDERGPVFRESWEAQAFAIVLTLHERGIFTWPEWTASLANEIRRAQSGGDPDTSETYYHHWLAALKQIVVAKGLTTSAMLTKAHYPTDTCPCLTTSERHGTAHSMHSRRLHADRRAGVPVIRGRRCLFGW
jgi:nitrile hydratase accessory protein